VAGAAAVGWDADERPAGPVPAVVALVGVALAVAVAVAVSLLGAGGLHLGWVAVVLGVALCTGALAWVALHVPAPRSADAAGGGRPVDADGSRPERLVAVPLALAVAVVLGTAVASTAALTLPVLGLFGLLVAVAAVVLFVRHFTGALLVLFVVRPALDQFKLGADEAAWTDPSVLSGLLFLAAAAVWLLLRHRRGQALRLSHSSAAFLALGVACVLSSLTAAVPFASMQASVRVIASAVMFIVLEEVLRDAPGRLPHLLVALFASLAVPAVFAGLQLVGSAPEQPTYGPAIEVGRIQGTFVHPNALATYLVVLIPLALALLPHVGRRARVGLGLCAVTSGVLLLFTYARAAWMAALVGVLIVGWLQDKRIITGVVVGVLVLVVAVPSVATRLGELGEGRDALTDDPNSLVWRIEYWGRVLPSMAEGPITGIGLGMVEAEQVEGLPPHNVFVQAAAETGIAGLASLALLVGALAADLRRGLRRAAGGLHRGVAVGAVAVAAGFLAQCFSENLLNQPVSHWYLLVPVAWVTTHSGRAPWVVGGGRGGGTVPYPDRRPVDAHA
jgi:O-antigen ligase